MSECRKGVAKRWKIKELDLFASNIFNEHKLRVMLLSGSQETKRDEQNNHIKQRDLTKTEQNTGL